MTLTWQCRGAEHAPLIVLSVTIFFAAPTRACGCSSVSKDILSRRNGGIDVHCNPWQDAPAAHAFRLRPCCSWEECSAHDGPRAAGGEAVAKEHIWRVAEGGRDIWAPCQELLLCDVQRVRLMQAPLSTEPALAPARWHLPYSAGPAKAIHRPELHAGAADWAGGGAGATRCEAAVVVATGRRWLPGMRSMRRLGVCKPVGL